MRKELYGLGPSEGVLAERVEAKLVSETGVRVDELRSLTIEGPLLHVCADDNDPLAKACQVEGTYSNRKLKLYASAQTGQILSAVLTPDATFKSGERSLTDLVAQFGEPRIFSIDNLPANSKELEAAMPTSKLTNDFKHFYSRIKNTMNSYASNATSQAKKLAAMFTRPRATGEFSVESIKNSLRGQDGGITKGGKVMIERGHGKTKAKFFTFGAEHDGIAMPEELIRQIESNGCFLKTFEANVARDWRSVEKEVRPELTKFRANLLAATKGYREALTAVRALAKQTNSNADLLITAHTVADAAEAAKEALLATTPDDELDMLGPETLESAATAAATAATTAFVSAGGRKEEVDAVIADERAMVESFIRSKPDLLASLEAVGATFHAKTHALEHTWTTATLPQLGLALAKLKWLDRPVDVIREIPTGTDSRGLPTFRVADGTNVAESGFGEIEKPISTNGGYNQNKWQGLLLSKIGRINERQRCKLHGVVGPGHHDLSRARRHNSLMCEQGLPLPHPSLEPLEPQSSALYGVDYFHAEIARQHSSLRSETVNTSVNAAPVPAASPALPALTAALLPAPTTADALISGTPAPMLAQPAETDVQMGGVRSAAERARDPDLPGIKPGMVYYDRGRHFQVHQLDLAHPPRGMKCCTCGARGRAAHSAGCEHGIISRAKDEAGLDSRNKYKRKR